jgi:hypothetical protein
VRRLVWAVVAAVTLVACGAEQDPALDVPSSTTTSTMPAPDVDRPGRWVGIDDAGRLVVVSGAASVERVLGEFDHPTQCPEGDEPVAGCSWVVEVAVSPDGATVFYETCCEPAPGNVYRVPMAGGTPELVIHGGFPAPDPAGERLAVVELQWVTVQPLGGGEARRFADEDGQVVEFVHGMSWSPDGLTLAFSVDDGLGAGLHVRRLQVEEATSFEDALPVRQPPGSSWTLPTYRYDGLLVVAEQDLAPADLPTSPARGLVVDPSTGTVVEEFDYGGPVRSQHMDAAGVHLLYTLADGSVRWRSAGAETGTLAPAGYLAAAW